MLTSEFIVILKMSDFVLLFHAINNIPTPPLPADGEELQEASCRRLT